MDAVPPRILTNTPHLLHGVITKQEDTSLVQDAHVQDELRWDLGHHCSTSAQFNIFVSSSNTMSWTMTYQDVLSGADHAYCLNITLLTHALKEQQNIVKDFS